MELTKMELQCLQRLRQIIQDSDDEILINGERNGELHDEYLIIFIRSRGYNVQSAFDRVRKMHHVRTEEHPTAYANLLPINFLRGFQSGGVELLKDRDLKGRQIMVVRSKCWDTNYFSGDYVFQMMMIAGWESLRTKKTQENGLIAIFDIEGFNLKHVRYFTPQFILKWANVIIQSSPVKLKAMHFVNMRQIFNISLSIIKMFAPRKAAERIFTHGKPTPGFFDEFVASESLPKWLGGQLDDELASDSSFMKELYTEEREKHYQQFADVSIAAMEKF